MPQRKKTLDKIRNLTYYPTHTHTHTHPYPQRPPPPPPPCNHHHHHYHQPNARLTQLQPNWLRMIDLDKNRFKHHDRSCPSTEKDQVSFAWISNLAFVLCGYDFTYGCPISKTVYYTAVEDKAKINSYSVCADADTGIYPHAAPRYVVKCV